MKKILLSLISIFTISTMCAHVTWTASKVIADIEISDFVLHSEGNSDLYIMNLEMDNDFFQDNSFTISPNPSKNRLNIRLPKSSENMTLEVFDVLGKRVHISTITNLDSSVDVSRWKTGVYLVKVSNEKESQTKRFIKQ